jgi:WD40 repeat protein/tetratricopeptide (TPR) repeat protein
MALQVACPSCGVRLAVADSVAADKAIKCPRCGAAFRLAAPRPAESGAPPAPAPAPPAAHAADGPPPSLGDLAAADRARVDERCDHFESAWKDWRSRPRPALEEYLPGVAGPAAVVLLGELLHLELGYRRLHGESPTLAEYLPRFPGQEALLRRVLATAGLAETVARGQTPAVPGTGETTRDYQPGQTPPGAAGDRAGPLPGVPGYAIEGVLGRGGMGVVYKARHLALKRTVALKMILAGGHAGAQERLRFKTEAEAVARLQHPHIVQVFEVGEHQGLPFCALEFVGGGSLDHKLKDQPLPTQESARLVEKLAEAMHLAHNRNVVHRDLKPANVLLTEDGAPKVTDFGLARHLDSDSGQTQSGAVMGTPAYMAPEQAAGLTHEAGPAADTYALGAILYACLTGRPPFQGATVAETLDLVRHREPVSPRLFQPAVPRDLETICLKCLQKEPPRRYSSAQALAEDLRRFLNHEPIRARPVGLGERAVKWARRRPAVAGLLAAVILVTVVGGTGIVWNWREAVWQAAEATAARGREQKKAEEATAAAAKEQKAKEDAQQAQAQAEAADKETTKKNEQLQRQLYVLNVQGAARALADNDARKAEALLLACPPPLRHWEWHYLLRQCRAELFAIDALVNGVFTADGRHLVTVWKDIDTYDTETGRRVGSVPFQGQRDYPVRLALSPDGKQLALLRERPDTQKSEVDVWETATGKLIHACTGFRSKAVAVAFSPDGSRLATCGGKDPRRPDPAVGEVRLWDAATGQVVLDVKQLPAVIQGVCFSPDGKQLAGAGTDGMLRLWDTATGQEVRAWAGHEGSANAVAFSPDGERLVSGGADHLVRIWGLRQEPPSVLSCRGHLGPVRAVAFGPDGTRVASGGDDRAVKVWGLEGEELAGYRGHVDKVSSVVFSPDGTHLASGGPLEVEVWDATRPPGSALALPKHARPAAFSPDGQRLVTGSRGELRVRDLATGQVQVVVPAAAHQQLVHSLAFRPDGKEFASAGRDGSVKLWDAAGGRLVRSFAIQGEAARALLYSPDGTRLAVRTEDEALDSTVRVLEASSGREVLAVRTKGAGMAFSPDGKRLALAGPPDRPAGTVHIVDLETRRPLLTLTGHKAEIADLAWHRNRLATLSTDGSINVWDAATGAVQLTMIFNPEPVRHPTSAGTVCFTPDGGRLVTGANAGGRDGKVTVWELVEGKEVLTLSARGGEAADTPLAVSPDGRHLLAAAESGPVQVLDGGRGALALTLRGRRETGDPTAVAFSPDGRWLAGGHNQASLWDAATGEELPPLPSFGHSLIRLTFSPDSRLLAAATYNPLAPQEPGEVKVWDVAGRREVLTFRGHAALIRDVAFAPDGRRLASASDDRTVKLWDAATGKVELTLRDGKVGFNGVAFSPDGARVAAAGTDRLIRVWEAGGRRPLLVCGSPARAGYFSGLAFSPDGKYLVAGGDVVTVWDVATGNELRTLKGVPAYVHRVVFSPDGKLLAAGAGGGGRVVVWDFATGREVSGCPLRGGFGGLDLAFSPDGTRLAVCKSEQNLDVWEVGTKWQALAADQGRQARERVPAWHRQRAGDTRGFAARFHLSWLIALEPNEGSHYAGRADANVALDRWDEAAADVARAVELLPDDASLWHQQALLRLRSGDAAGYRRTCAGLLKRLGQTTEPATAALVAWTCCLAPGSAEDPQAVVALAERAVAGQAAPKHPGTLGAALCRAGRHEEAVSRLQEAKAHALGGEPADWFVLAVAHHHRQQPDKAREAFDRGLAQEKTVPPQTWQARLEVERLRAEAAKLFQEKKP